MSWFAENLSTIIISLVIAAIVALVIVYLVRNKKQGKNSCGCGCSKCPMSGSCHSHKG